MKNNNRASGRTIKRVIKYIKPYRISFVFSLVLAVITVSLTLYVPIIIGNAIDCLAGPGAVNFEAIAALLLKMGIVISVTAVLQWIMGICNNRITYNTVRDIRRDAFDKIQRLPVSYIDNHRHGGIVSRVISDVDVISDGLLLGFTQIFTGVLTIAGTLCFMLRISFVIALVVVILTPLSLFVSKYIASKTYGYFRTQAQTREEETALAEEAVSSQKTVKAFSMENKLEQSFGEINEKLEKATVRAVFFSSLVNPSTRLINGIVYACVALAGSMVAISGGITIGGLSSFLSYANQYTKPFNEISGVIAEFQNALACAARVFELIDEKPQTPDAPDAVTLRDAHGNVDFNNVSFSYDPEKPLLKEVNLSVKAGWKIAIVGPTGCGKTTLINLLMRFYDVDGGAINVDGNDIRSITRRSLRKNYGMVLQDTWLKNASVRDNIAFGMPDASDDKIIEAAKAAHAHSFIRRLPEGYDTILGEDGGNLSNGQKQLLSIARIMLCLPPVLILDEATSSIDTRTEVKIQKAFEKLMNGRTSFIVAHRLSTVQNADRIIVMRDGNIIESGMHQQLLEKNGFYTHLYNSQFAH